MDQNVIAQDVNIAALLVWTSTALVSLYLLSSAQATRMVLLFLSVVFIILSYVIELFVPQQSFGPDGPKVADVLMLFAGVPTLLACFLASRYKSSRSNQIGRLLSSSMPTLIIDQEGSPWKFNPSFAKHFPVKGDTIKLPELHKALRKIAKDNHENEHVAPSLLDDVNIRHDGVDWTAYLVPIEDRQGRGADKMVLYFLDVTELRRNTRELAKTRQILGKIFEYVPISVWSADMWGNITFQVGDDRFFGPVGAQNPKRNIRRIFSQVEDFEDRFRAAKQGEQQRVLAEVQGGIWAESYFAKDGYGKTADSIFGISIDVTERENNTRALREAEQSLQQNERLESVGRLAGGIAHDFNNVLMAISGALELYGDGGEGADRFLKVARRATEKGADLTQRLLSFSSKQGTRVEIIDPARTIQDVGRLVQPVLPRNVELKVEAKKNLGGIAVDPSQFENAVMNLAINARDALTEGGDLILRVEYLDEPFFRAKLRKDAPDPATRPRTVRITVEDTGMGMSPEVLEKACEPFFTTKGRAEPGAAKGTGLGLSSVYGFVNRAQGRMKIDSLQGKGTKVILEFEQMTLSKPTQKQVNNVSRLRREERTVLLVEDDPAVMGLLKEYLASQGCRVITANTGEEGLEMVKEVHDIEAVVSDLVLPGKKSGLDVVKAARTKFPDAKIVLISGYPDEEIEFSPDDPVCFMRKPVSFEVLNDQLGLSGAPGGDDGDDERREVPAAAAQ